MTMNDGNSKNEKAWFDHRTNHCGARRVDRLDLPRGSHRRDGAFSSLPSVEHLSKGNPEENAETLKRAVEDCGRVDRLKSSFIARYARGAEIKQLAEQCDLIRAQAEAVEGP